MKRPRGISDREWINILEVELGQLQAELSHQNLLVDPLVEFIRAVVKKEFEHHLTVYHGSE